MEFNVELINENELNTISTIYQDIPSNFKNSITINPQFNNEIEEIYSRALLNLGRSILSLFNLKYLEMFEELARYYEHDDRLFELSKSIIRIFNSYFKELNDNLFLKNEKDFDELKFILEVSLITIEEVVEDKNVELAYEAFFQIERSIEKEELYKKSTKFIIPNLCEFNIYDGNIMSDRNIIKFIM
ncbi:MAG: hypothetical protein IKH85_07630 [Methanobrevibacter sp.]|uniref:hypothetical protein n=1 Tax=Methanobrevibacter sp. TaxID=66852 RepID=UPI0026009407|nr:hypothetical protein [Methanobrevibacter sp.]MBR6993929.1 hypothetical protein [Methanobrevibacter sp.]